MSSSEVGRKVNQLKQVVKDNVSIDIKQDGTVAATNNSGGDVYYSSSKEARSGSYSISFTVYAGEFEKEFKTVINLRDIEVSNKKLLVRAILHAVSAGVITVNNSTDVAINFPFGITVGVKMEVKEMTIAERDAFLEDVAKIVNIGVDEGVYGFMETQGLPLPKDIKETDEKYVRQSTEFEFMTMLSKLTKPVSEVVDNVIDAVTNDDKRPAPSEATADFSLAGWDDVCNAFKLANMALCHLSNKITDFRDIKGKPKSKSLEMFLDYTQSSLTEHLEQVGIKYGDGEVKAIKAPSYNEREFVSLMETTIMELKL